MSYGTDLIDHARQAASYVDRILRGAKAADLPVQAPTKFELVINLKTAKALGFKLPTSVLARAPALLDAKVAADRPAQLLQRLPERGIAGRRLRIVCGETREHADAPHALALLRARCERPSGHTAA